MNRPTPELPHLPPRLLRALLGLLAAFLMGCFDTEKEPRLAGGDDYPNGVDPLGKKGAGAMRDSADWNGFDTVPTTAPGLYDTVDVPDGAPDTARDRAPADPADGAAPALARASVPSPGTGIPPAGPDTLLPGGGRMGPDTLVIRVLDSAKGTVETVRTRVSDSGVRTVDSAVTAPADPSRPGSAPAVTRAARTVVSADSSRVEAWVFTDGDGDGFLAPRAGSANVARVERTVRLADGTVERGVRRLAAGADLDFGGRGDNRLLASALLRLRGADTLGKIDLVDVDGDGVLIDFSKDTNLVDVVEEVRYPAGGALLSVTRAIRIVASSRDSTRNYPIRYSERRTFRDGTVLEIAARGLAADSAFRPGAEARWSETRFRPSGDSLARAARTFRVRLAEAPGDFGRNVLLGFAVEEEYRGGAGIEAFAFDFRCAAPVADGRWVAAGDVVSWLVLPGGKRVSFAGTTASGGLRGQVTGPGGASAAIAFDAAGDIVPLR
jgi:hypothetical protein